MDSPQKKCSAAVLLAVLAACNPLVRPDIPTEFPVQELEFTASREGLAPGTRSVRQGDGSVLWSPAEEVSVFYGSGSNGGSKLTSNNTKPAETVKLTGSVQMTGTGKDYWAVYPYSADNSCDGNSITTVIPTVQTAVPGNFSGNAFPAMAKSKTLDLAFWNLCGGIKFTLSRGDVQSVSFKGNMGETLAGKISFAFGGDSRPAIGDILDSKTEVTLRAPEGETFEAGADYYITLLPGLLGEGFTIEITTAGHHGSVCSFNPQTIKRSTFGVLRDIDTKVENWEPNDIEAHDGCDLVGRVLDKSTGKGIPGVVVSDGYDCVATDADGVYQIKSNDLSRLVYISIPAEYKIPVATTPGTPLFYMAVSPNGSVIRNDFELTPLPGGKETSWTFIGVGDPQCATSGNATRYTSETIPDIKSTTAGRSSVYAMTLGDIVFDSTNMWPTMKSSMSAVHNGTCYIPFFQCIGNHDHDSLKPDTSDDAMDDYNSTSTYVSYFGPTDYSFNRGDVHIVVMDDIMVSSQKTSTKSNGLTWNFTGGFTDKQLAWLKKDLELVPDKENKMVFLCSHMQFRGSYSNHFMDAAKLLLSFKEAHLMIGHTHYTQNFVYGNSFRAKGGLTLYEHIHGSACGSWWTSSCSSTVTGEPSGYTVYDIEGPHIKDWFLKGTRRDASFQLRVFNGNDIYYQSNSYPLNWYTASQKAGSSNITVKGNTNLRYCFVAQVFNDDDTYWTVEMRKKSTGEKTGSFKRLANQSCANIAATAYYFNAKGKNSDNYASVTASHYWYYMPSSKSPADESDWEVVATQVIPGGEITHSYTCSKLTVESDFAKDFYFF